MMLSDISLSDVCLSVAYIGNNSRNERPRKTKIVTQVDSDTTFKVKRSKVNLQDMGILWQTHYIVNIR